jgi:diguanylate cyclase (GGDEF)-like protein
MISIKKFIERNGEELFRATLDSYRAVLRAVGQSAVEACPPVGSSLQQKLLCLQEGLTPESTAGGIQQTGEKIETEIAQWGSGASDYFKQRAGEVKELMVILAHTAEATGERDQRYSRRFHEFTGRLEALADLHDLAAIRDSLVKSAIDLKACAQAMAEESEKSLARLRQDVSAYQARLDDAERLAGQDALTGLDNRRRVESSIECRIAQHKPFSILMLDLNEFKKVNDTYGHLAADGLLKQFSAELRSGFRATDVVGRWGGDEFLVVLDAGRAAVETHVQRIARWVFGDYTLQAPGGPEGGLKVTVSAAIGTAEWHPGDSLQTLVDRADRAMYEDKRGRSRAHPVVPAVRR